MARLQGKVAVVTGAGRGIGRSHVRVLAREGAHVLVNDPGVERDGTGASGVADTVAAEIGGLANRDSVDTTEGAESIIRAAVKEWGRIDILVNNAGILRDKTALKMTDEQWDTVLAVHLRGTFACSRAAARVMKEKETGGRIINTTSVSGLIGNFGQANYAAAKAGIYGLTRVLALELERYGIFVNAVAPIAKTRMTEDIESLAGASEPEDVSAMMLYLATAEVTGRIFGVEGKHLFEYTMERSEGVRGDAPWTPEEIAAKLGDIGRKSE